MEIARRQKPAASAAYGGRRTVNGSGRRTFVTARVQKVQNI